MASERESSAEWQSESTSADDDMDYELATEESTTPSAELLMDEEDEDEGTTQLYFDAEDGTLFAEQPSVEDAEDEQQGSQTPQASAGTQTNAQQGQTITITQRQILQLLGSAGLRGFFSSAPSGVTTRAAARRAQAQQYSLADGSDEEEEAEEQDDEIEDDEDFSETWIGYGRRRRRRTRPFVGDRYPKIPSEAGAELMSSGTFGTNDRCDHSACGQPLSKHTRNKRRRLSRRLLDRELGTGSSGRMRALNALASQDLIPGSKADMIINLNSRCYSGQFSEDGSFFFACGQDFKVRMYDTSNPYDWRYYKTVNYYAGQWTITDASLSPDNKFLAYSSIRSQVCLAPTDPADSSDPQLLDFSDTRNGRHGFDDGGRHFGIWSLRFSGDGTEIVAGTSNESVYVYDLETRRSILRIPGHTDDVNAVCFGDKMSPHILYSGSDDTTVKVWDRRSLSSMRPAGMFLGHTEGVTYIDSKGDGRYVISNGKDQTCKLWDLRKMISTDKAERLDPRDYTTGFDYRFSAYDTDNHEPHPHDCSLVTFRGHRVLKTLIRCHFSPASSTDQRYIYSGSHDGKIYVWNLDGTTKSVINVLAATKNSRPVSDERYADTYDYYGRTGTWKTIVRDCSWHPSAPVIAATSWNGWDHQLGTCTVHSWDDGVGSDEVGDERGRGEHEGGQDRSKTKSLGSTPMGARVTAQLQHDARFYSSQNERTIPATARRAERLRDRLGWIGGGGGGNE